MGLFRAEREGQLGVDSGGTRLLDDVVVVGLVAVDLRLDVTVLHRAQDDLLERED